MEHVSKYAPSFMTELPDRLAEQDTEVFTVEEAQVLDLIAHGLVPHAVRAELKLGDKRFTCDCRQIFIKTGAKTWPHVVFTVYGQEGYAFMD